MTQRHLGQHASLCPPPCPAPLAPTGPLSPHRLFLPFLVPWPAGLTYSRFKLLPSCPLRTSVSTTAPWMLMWPSLGDFTPLAPGFTRLQGVIYLQAGHLLMPKPQLPARESHLDVLPAQPSVLLSREPPSNASRVGVWRVPCVQQTVADISGTAADLRKTSRCHLGPEDEPLHTPSPGSSLCPLPCLWVSPLWDSSATTLEDGLWKWYFPSGVLALCVVGTYFPRLANLPSYRTPPCTISTSSTQFHLLKHLSLHPPAWGSLHLLIP